MISDPHDLFALIAALEAATVGSRELDERIALHVGWAVQPDGQAQAGIPAYSTSLDAALTLVPDGRTWRINSPPLWLENGLFRANVINVSGHECDAATPALALCCAALRSKIPN